MKKTINGLRYSTENSTKIGHFNNGLDQSDLQFWEADLYTYPRSSRFFLVGKGGPMTRFGILNVKSIGKVKPIGWDGTLGEKLIPISKENAFEWGTAYLTPGEVKEYFADMIPL